MSLSKVRARTPFLDRYSWLRMLFGGALVVAAAHITFGLMRSCLAIVKLNLDGIVQDGPNVCDVVALEWRCRERA
jgi:hypothetical protein